MHIEQRIPPPGFAQQREDRRQHQYRLQSFPQQNPEGTEEGCPRWEPRLVEALLGLHQEILNAAALRFEVGNRFAVLEHAPVAHHLCLDRYSETLIDGVETGLDWLEAVEVGGYREFL